MNQGCREFISAKNIEDLISCLKSIDIEVPSRLNGRTTEHTERYSICRLLSTLAKTQYIDYPISLVKRENPDFLLVCNEKTIGIEITESTSQDYSEYLALHEREATDGHFIESAHFRFGIKITLEEKRELCSKDTLTACGWVGDGMESEWKLFINATITQKCLKSKNYNKFSQNWLLVYDNTPSSFLDQEFLLPYIKELTTPKSFEFFDRVFIETRWFEENSENSKSIIIMITRDGVDVMPLEDIWRSSGT